MSAARESSRSDLSIHDLVAHSQAVFMKWHQGLREERDRRLDELHHQNLVTAGRAFNRFVIYDELLKREVKERIRIYKSVADEYGCVKLLSKAHLHAFCQTIMTTVSNACLTVQELNERDYRAVGENAPVPQAGRYEALKATILTVVNTELDVLETEGRLRARVPLQSSSDARPDFKSESSVPTSAGSDPRAPVTAPPEIQTESTPRARSRSQRQSSVDAFLAACNAAPGQTFVAIIEKHIWLSVGHRKARQFQYWKCNHGRATAADNANFPRILGMEPPEFIELLKAKKIIKASIFLANPRLSSP